MLFHMTGGLKLEKKASVQYVCTKTTPRSQGHIIWVTKTNGVEGILYYSGKIIVIGIRLFS